HRHGGAGRVRADGGAAGERGDQRSAGGGDPDAEASPGGVLRRGAGVLRLSDFPPSDQGDGTPAGLQNSTARCSTHASDGEATSAAVLNLSPETTHGPTLP